MGDVAGDSAPLRWDCTACLPGEGCNAVNQAEGFLVVVLTGPQAGAEVTSDGVPWRGTLTDARALASQMETQAHRFGHPETTYCVEALAPQNPCDCGHQWSEHDQGGCHYQDGCVLDGTTEVATNG